MARITRAEKPEPESEMKIYEPAPEPTLKRYLLVELPVCLLIGAIIALAFYWKAPH